MKTISKIIVGILFSSLVITSSFAGELSVTGGATATYATNGDDAAAGKNLGISNEIDFSASGELDNGYTWNYQVQLDTAASSNDDTRLEIGTDMGTVGFYVSEGGMSAELHGVGAMGPGFDYVSPTSFNAGYDVDGYSNIQYHTPAGLLPMGAVVKLGFVPDMNDTTMLSAKESNSNPASQATGRTLQMAAISLTPIDGLVIKGDAAETGEETGAANTSNGFETGVSANLGASYTIGALSLGYVEGGHQPAIASGEIAWYENQFYGASYAVNDALTVSYNIDKSEKNQKVAVAVEATKGTTTVTEMKQKSLQLAYTTGGATIGIAQVDVDNSDYTEASNETQTVVSLGISF